jgi:ribose-phosphate pyrophosphokinase
MKTINLITGERVKKILFPDNQPHVVLTDIEEVEDVRVVANIRSSLELVQLMMTVSAIRGLGANQVELVIPYLMGARYDRIINKGDSFDLKVVADVINSLGFSSVHLFDVHSPVATELIHNSKSHNNSLLVKSYDHPDAVLIVPDKGAVQKARDYPVWNHNLSSVAFCEKERDLETGRVSLKVISPEVCEGRNCVIIDDICDGGATFMAIADQIKPKHLTLIVSHGIFSKGFRSLEEKFDQIITSDSFWTHSSNKLKTIPLNL